MRNLGLFVLGLFLIAGFLFSYTLRARREGRVFFLYIFLYALLRFFVEFLRGDNIHYFYLTLPQWMSLSLLAPVALIFVFQRNKK